MIKEHERIVLLEPVPSARLVSGDIGTVVHVYAGGRGYEVEFVGLDGMTVAVVTVAADKVRPVRENEIPHARDLSAA